MAPPPKAVTKSKGKFSTASSRPSPAGGRKDAAVKRKRIDNHASRGKASAGSDNDEEGDDDLLAEYADDGGAADSDNDTEDEIENAKEGKSKKTQKRKRRAVSPTSFGEALSAFLDDEPASSDEPRASTSQVSAAESSKPKAKPAKSSAAPNQAPIFSLAPSVRSRISSTQLNAKASRIALEERRKREEQYRVKDLIGGWGKPGERPGQTVDEGRAMPGEDSDGEDDASHDAWFREGGSKGYERRLRKVAQRGVVKLFNAIRAAQSTTDEDLQESKDKTMSSSTHASTPSRPGQDTVTGKNALGGKSKELADLSKNNFLSMIRSGAGKTAKA